MVLNSTPSPFCVGCHFKSNELRSFGYYLSLGPWLCGKGVKLVAPTACQVLNVVNLCFSVSPVPVCIHIGKCLTGLL
jgi:hypothetical protein